MRDFLFKIWHKDLNKFADNIIELGDTHAKFTLENGKQKLIPLKSNKLIRLPYTSIDDDVSNTMIFEGDIIEIMKYDRTKKDYIVHLSDVVWDSDCYLVMCYGEDYHSNPLFTYPYGHNKFPVSWVKVVGNIYEDVEVYEQLKKNNIIK